jgi:hypothetical protein
VSLSRCPSCDGVGWFEDELDGNVLDCDWCGGVGYVYRDAVGVDTRIPASDWGRLADQLEQLEAERMREMGYTGNAKKPWEQDIREGTKGGENPYERE